MEKYQGIREALSLYKFGLCLEITNSVVREKYISSKVRPVLEGKKKFSKLVKGSEVIAGFAFLNTSVSISDVNPDGLSFLQHMSYERDRLVDAFGIVESKADGKKEKNMFARLRACWSKGVDLELLLNPTPDNWDHLQSRHRDELAGFFPESRVQYLKLIQEIKGRLLEEYVNKVYELFLPDAFTVMRVPLGRTDIDLFVSYHKAEMMKAIDTMGVIWLDPDESYSPRKRNYVNIPSSRRRKS